MFTGKKSLSSILLAVFVIFFLFTQLMIGLKLNAPLVNKQWFIDKKAQKADIIDFFQYYQASDLANSKNANKVYDVETQRKWAQDLIKPLPVKKVFYNQQPPSSYTLLYPLSFLPVNLAYVFWCLIQLIFALLCLYQVTKLGPLNKESRLLFLAGVLAAFPTYSLIWHGNTTLFLLGLLSLVVVFLYQRKDLVAGAVLSIATFKPQYFFPLAIPPFSMKRWKLFVGFILMEVVLLGIAVGIIGLDNVINYPYIVTHAESSKDFIGVNAHKMISIRGLFAQFFSTGMSLKITALVMFASLIPLLIVWKKASANISVNGLRWLWAATICTIVLVSPHSHLFDFLLLAIPAALTLPTVSITELSSLPISTKLWTALLIVFPPLSWIANFSIGQEMAPVFFFFPYVLVLFLISIVRLKEELSISNNAMKEAEAHE